MTWLQRVLGWRTGVGPLISWAEGCGAGHLLANACPSRRRPPRPNVAMQSARAASTPRATWSGRDERRSTPRRSPRPSALRSTSEAVEDVVDERPTPPVDLGDQFGTLDDADAEEPPEAFGLTLVEQALEDQKRCGSKPVGSTHRRVESELLDDGSVPGRAEGIEARARPCCRRSTSRDRARRRARRATASNRSRPDVASMRSGSLAVARRRSH